MVDDWTPLEELSRSEVARMPPRRAGIVPRAQVEAQVIRQWDDELFQATAMQLADAMRWAELPGDAKEPPEDWIEQYGEERAWAAFRAAMAAKSDRRTAPVGLDMTKALFAAMLRAREARKQTGSQSLTIVNMPSPTFTYPVIEVDVVAQEAIGKK